MRLFLKACLGYWMLLPPSLPFSHFLRNVVGVINVSILCVTITKLPFLCMCIKFDFSYFKTS